MQPIKDLADSREREAGVRLAEAQRRVTEHEQKLAQLTSYRDEYLARTLPGVSGTDPVRLANYSAFLDRLNESLRVQEGLISDAKLEAERRLQEWQSLKVEASALSRAMDRFRQDEQRDSERREQRDQDERAMQRAVKPEE